MRSPEATPLLRARALGQTPHAPSQDVAGDGERSRRLLEPSRPRPMEFFASGRVFLTMLGFAMAMAAGFMSTTQYIERSRRPSQQQQQQQQQQQRGEVGAVGSVRAATGGVGSRGNEVLAKTFHEKSNVEPSAPRLGGATLSGASATGTTAAASTAAVNGAGSTQNGHGFKREDHTYNPDAWEGVNMEVGGGGADDDGGTLRSDGHEAGAGGG